MFVVEEKQCAEQDAGYLDNLVVRLAGELQDAGEWRFFIFTLPPSPPLFSLEKYCVVNSSVALYCESGKCPQYSVCLKGKL